MQRSIQTRKLYSKGMPRHSVKGNSIPKLILRRSKPSFQPSIPNIHLTSKHQLETGAVHCSPLRSSLLTIGRTPSETLFSSLRGAMHHTRCYQIVDVHATNHQATKIHLTGKHGTWKKPFETVSKPLSSRNQNKFPSLTPRTTKHHHASHTLPETQMKSRSRWKSPDIKTETFAPKMNRQKSKPETFAPKIESPEIKIGYI